MPFFERDEIRIHYELHGDGPPLLAFAPGGMLSSIDRWNMLPWHPATALSNDHQVILMDQRNAGQSTAPIDGSTGWSSYASDQLALLDHLGIERCQLLGCCIGCSFILGLIEAAHERVISGVLMQPIGASRTNEEAYRHLFGDWLTGVRNLHPNMTDTDWDALHTRMFGSDFVFNVTRSFVRTIRTPLLVLAGSDVLHPPETSQEVANLAQQATLIKEWKDPEHIGSAAEAIAEFLRTHA